MKFLNFTIKIQKKKIKLKIILKKFQGIYDFYLKLLDNNILKLLWKENRYA